MKGRDLVSHEVFISMLIHSSNAQHAYGYKTFNNCPLNHYNNYSGTVTTGPYSNALI